MKIAWTLLVLAGFLGAASFVGLYAIRSREWYLHPVGRNLMAMAAVLAGLLGMSLVALLVPIWPWLWLGGMASLDIVLWWLVVTLWRVQRAGHR